VVDAIQRARDGGRRAELGLKNDHVLRSNDTTPELTEHTCKGITGILAAPLVRTRQLVAGPTEGVVGLLEAELADVARDRRLRHGAAKAAERGEELVLRPNALPRDDACDQAMTIEFRHRPHLHNASISIQVFLRLNTETTQAC
jgi:hypothetical protein